MNINNIAQLIENAKTGNTIAQVHLAYEYTKGQNIAKDLVKAFKLYELAAYKGNLTAMFNLAQFYLNGTLTDKGNCMKKHRSYVIWILIHWNLNYLRIIMRLQTYQAKYQQTLKELL